ncbi:MAG: hypothetical protein M3P04_07715 [Actinomycetota bacterium]|nr:hypothetical protein [Actinomycetota bacterium]
MTLAIVVPSGDSPQDGLLTEEPTPTATTEVTPSPVATSSPLPSASAEASDAPAPDATTTPRAAPRAPQLDQEHLVSDAFMNEAFGQGRASEVGTWPWGWGAPVACWATQQQPEGTTPLSRTWAWPDEIVVGETFTSLPTTQAASDRLAWCRKQGPPAFEHGPYVSHSVDLGDEAYVATRDAGLFTELQAGARVGRNLVLLFWRQSGPAESSAPLERALRQALETALGDSESAAITAPAPRRSDLLRGYLTYQQLLPYTRREGRWIGMNWWGDREADKTGLYCGGQAEDPWMPTDERPVTRSWVGGNLNGDDGYSIGLSIGHAVDPSSAADDFAACRETAGTSGGTTTTIDLGDEAFVVDASADGERPEVFVRAGSTYLVLRSHSVGKDVTPVARAALDRYLADNPA